VTPAGRLYSGRVALSSPSLAKFFAKFFAKMFPIAHRQKNVEECPSGKAIRAAHCSPALRVKASTKGEH
jgi:hypothetical protein